MATPTEFYDATLPEEIPIPDWTHLHRGITSPTETKYIITGWFSWVENNGNSNYKIVKRKNEKD